MVRGQLCRCMTTNIVKGFYLPLFKPFSEVSLCAYEVAPLAPINLVSGKANGPEEHVCPKFELHRSDVLVAKAGFPNANSGGPTCHRMVDKHIAPLGLCESIKFLFRGLRPRLQTICPSGAENPAQRSCISVAKEEFLLPQAPQERHVGSKKRFSYHLSSVRSDMFEKQAEIPFIHSKKFVNSTVWLIRIPKY